MRHLVLATLTFLCISATSAGADSSLQGLIDAGHWKRARVLAERSYQSNPNDVEAAYLHSRVKFAFGDLEGALALAEKVVALEPKNSSYHVQLAEVCGRTAEKASLFSKGHWAKRFREESETAASLDPKNLNARFDLLEFYLQAPRLMGGGQDKARAMADEIAKVDSVSGLLAQARLAREQKDWGKEQEAYIKAAATAPKNYNTMVEIANFFLRPTGGGKPGDTTTIDPPSNPVDAEKFARQAVKLDPGHAAAYAALARLYAIQQRWKDLDAVLIEAEKNVPDNLRPCYRAAEVLFAENKDLPRAERYFRKYLSQEPEPDSPTLAEAQRELGLVLEKEGRKS
ncbi:MAG: tetratricopeptide repeat protein [Terriglobia bacterium]